jgi:hypothetical protein
MELHAQEQYHYTAKLTVIYPGEESENTGIVTEKLNEFRILVRAIV